MWAKVCVCLILLDYKFKFDTSSLEHVHNWPQKQNILALTYAKQPAWVLGTQHKKNRESNQVCTKMGFAIELCILFFVPALHHKTTHKHKVTLF